MQHGIPAVMFITWPDMWYHSSEDTPDKQDPTQYKRAAVVGTGSLAVLASGTDEMAARVLQDNLGRGLSRMGESHTKGLGYLADAPADAGALAQAYKEARVAIQHQAGIEKAVVQSASVLWTNVEDGKKKTAVFQPLIDQRASALLNEVKAAFPARGRAARRAGNRAGDDGRRARGQHPDRPASGGRRAWRWCGCRRWRRRTRRGGGSGRCDGYAGYDRYGGTAGDWCEVPAPAGRATGAGAAGAPPAGAPRGSRCGRGVAAAAVARPPDRACRRK